jgi:hypothetical protein
MTTYGKLTNYMLKKELTDAMNKVEDDFDDTIFDRL